MSCIMHVTELKYGCWTTISKSSKVQRCTTTLEASVLSRDLADDMSVHGYHGGFVDSDDDYYSPSEEGSPWILEREIGKGGFGLVKLYINQVAMSLRPQAL